MSQVLFNYFAAFIGGFGGCWCATRLFVVPRLTLIERYTAMNWALWMWRNDSSDVYRICLH